MIAAAQRTRDAGIRKAAILVASLDREAADLLLEQLPAEYAERVRRIVVTIDEVDAEERQRVIDEFRRIGVMIPQPCPPGVELDGLSVRPFGEKPMPASEPLEPVKPALSFGAEQTRLGIASSDSTPFGFLHEAEEERLAQLLLGERPQTIALVLSHLPPERAGEMLARLAAPLQIEVVRRLADIEHTDPETLREVEQAIESRLLRQVAAEPKRTSGPETLARILAACPNRIAGNILENLAEHDGTLAEQLGRRPIAFDDLDRLDDATLMAAVRAAEPEVVQAALLGAAPALVERVLCRMTSKESRVLRRSLNFPGPIRLSDIEDARQQLAALARRASYRSPKRAAVAA